MYQPPHSPISEMSKCLYPHHLSVCCCCCCCLSLSLWLGLTQAASQHNENAINFFQQFLFAPPSHGRQRLRLWLQHFLWSRCCCNIMTPAVCTDSRPGSHRGHSKKKADVYCEAFSLTAAQRLQRQPAASPTATSRLACSMNHSH